MSGKLRFHRDEGKVSALLQIGRHPHFLVDLPLELSTEILRCTQEFADELARFEQHRKTEVSPAEPEEDDRQNDEDVSDLDEGNGEEYPSPEQVAAFEQYELRTHLLMLRAAPSVHENNEIKAMLATLDLSEVRQLMEYFSSPDRIAWPSPPLLRSLATLRNCYPDEVAQLLSVDNGRARALLDVTLPVAEFSNKPRMAEAYTQLMLALSDDPHVGLNAMLAAFSHPNLETMRDALAPECFNRKAIILFVDLLASFCSDDVDEGEVPELATWLNELTAPLRGGEPPSGPPPSFDIFRDTIEQLAIESDLEILPNEEDYVQCVALLSDPNLFACGMSAAFDSLPSFMHDIVVFGYHDLINPDLDHSPNLVRRIIALMDLFGPSARLVSSSWLDPQWLTETVVGMARCVAFTDPTAVAILADSFGDANCDDFDVLDYCRQTHPLECRHLWLTDAIFGLARPR